VLRLFSQIAPRLIIEFPPPEEINAASGSGTKECLAPIDAILGRFYLSVIKIGETPSTTDPAIMRGIYLAQNERLYREGLLGNVTGYGGRRHSLAYSNRRWVLDGSRDITDDPGINLFNALYFEPVYPLADVTIRQLLCEYRDKLEIYGCITDAHPRNVLFTPSGMKVIDCLEHFGKDDKSSDDKEQHQADVLKYMSARWCDIVDAIEDGSALPYCDGYEHHK
jgi:hypothetical protein